MRTCDTILIAGLFFANAINLQAHPGHEDEGVAPVDPSSLHEWRRADGSSLGNASFLNCSDGVVQLRRADGGRTRIVLARLSEADRAWVIERTRRIEAANSQPIAFVSGSLEADDPMPAIQRHFQAFKKLEVRSDADYLYFGSDGFPDHPMMKGIKAWQQQVPLPQAYTGKNAWQIPLKPALADKPVSAKTALFRGAIALAVNGVPIFNALNNRGEDAYLIGELDEYGGHCGRADDYHYHMGPVHLEKTVGKGNPIGYALDGFALYGYTDASGKEPTDLDEFNGRMEKDGYRYYSTKKYPYINGGMRGVVAVRGDQVDPQPRAGPIRPAGLPLRGASITEFIRDDEKNTYTLKYVVKDQPQSIRYTINTDGTYTFVFVDSDGKQTTETYRRRELKEGGPKKDGKDGPSKKDGKDRPPPKKDDSSPKEEPSTIQPRKGGGFTLTSPAFEHGGDLPIEFTGAGDGISPPLAWSGAPQGTKSYALQLWHRPGKGDDVKSYWVIYNIPPDITSLPKNTKGIGTDGYNDKNRSGYDPMNSKGPGVKEYHITIYALSAEPKFSRDRVNRAELLTAIRDLALAESTLSCRYERTAARDGEQSPTKKRSPSR